MSDVDDDITNDISAKNSNENAESALGHGSTQNDNSPNVTSTSGSTNQIAAPLSVVIPDGDNPHTIVVGPCSPSDGGQSPKSERSHQDGDTKDTEHQNPTTNVVATQPKLDMESSEHLEKAENLTINVVPHDIENNNTAKDESEIKEEQEDASVKSEQPRTPSPSPRPLPLTQPPVPGHLLLASTAIKDHLFADLPTRSLPPTFLASHHDPIFSLQAADHRSRHSFPVPFSL